MDILQCIQVISNDCEENIKLYTFSVCGHICPMQGPVPLNQGHEFYNIGRGFHEHHTCYHIFSLSSPAVDFLR